ncbi:MAG: 16S rRNA (guanine(966)-N(2))-methyltransferase RsmD [Motilibacteraceae bacterium]
MTRVVAGVAGGRRLAVPPGHGTRPTSDRAREALFSTLEALRGPLAGARVLDLYAGSGAVGLEALSRGAGAALLVEADARAARTVRENVRALGLPGARVEAAKVERVLGAPAAAPFDVVFADPPYAVTDAEVVRVLEALRDHGWVAPDSVVVVERATRGADLAWPAGFEPLRSRRYGEATLWYGRAASGPAPDRPTSDSRTPDRPASDDTTT